MPVIPGTAARHEDEQRAGLAAVYVSAQRAESTRRAYASDWADFEAWCDHNGFRPPLPASADDVANYLIDRAQDGLSVSTLQRRLAAIGHYHQVADHAAPDTKRGHLASVWGGIRRKHGRPPRQKRPILLSDLAAIVARLPANLPSLRDRAILLLGFAAALRREEIAGLALGDAGHLRLAFTGLGIEISIDKSKGDQSGRGAVISVPYGQTALCPVLAVRAWLEAARIGLGPVFRPIDRWGHLSGEAMTPKSVCAVVKASAGPIGIDPATVGGHSLRAGMVTQAILNGVPVPLIMQTTRHKRTDTMNKYVRLAGLMQASAAGQLGL